MNKSIYTEYVNLTEYNKKWLDECGMKSGSGKSFSNIRFMGDWDSIAVIQDKFNYLPKEFYASMNFTHLPTGDAFCQGVAGILGIEYVPEKPFTRKLINKLELHDKMERPLPEGTISKTETVTEDKGLAIDVKLLSEENREWLVRNLQPEQKIKRALELSDQESMYFAYIIDLSIPLCANPLNFGFAPKEFYESKCVPITTDPTEFIRYVATKTGKEWGEKPMFGKNQIEIDLDEQLFPGEGALTNEDVMELLGDKVGYGSYKTYRVLDSLDGVPFDKRIPLSEWVPPFGVDVNFIHNGDFDRGQIHCIAKEGIIVKWRSLDCVFDADGHWMRIV